MLRMFAYDRKEILTSHKVESGKTIVKFLRSMLKTPKQANHGKRHELLAARPIHLHDNATQHGANGVTSLVRQYEWEAMDPWVRINRKIAPVAFTFFPKPEGIMRGIRNNNLGELKFALAARVHLLLPSNGNGLPYGKSVTDHKLYYFEGIQNGNKLKILI